MGCRKHEPFTGFGEVELRRKRLAHLAEQDGYPGKPMRRRWDGIGHLGMRWAGQSSRTRAPFWKSAVFFPKPPPPFAAGCSLRHPGCSMRGAGCSLRRSGCSVLGAGCSIRRPGCSMLGAGCSLRCPGSIPFGAGSLPFRRGSIPFAGTTPPFCLGSIPFGAGTSPFYRGSIPFGAPTPPFRRGSIPFGGATPPSRPGAIPFGAPRPPFAPRAAFRRMGDHLYPWWKPPIFSGCLCTAGSRSKGGSELAADAGSP